VEEEEDGPLVGFQWIFSSLKPFQFLDLGKTERERERTLNPNSKL
jgi:hypothetical protein